MPRACLALLALTLVACQNPERDELLTSLEDFEYERDSVRALLCSCPDVLGYASEDECIADEPPVDASARECIADEFKGSEQTAIDYYSCITPASNVYGDCLRERVGSCADDWYVSCQDDYESAVADCPDLSDGEDAKITACVNG
ncbi:hypothetical protein ACNOYE_07325 [Nannocystaceae bacterium ST9]